MKRQVIISFFLLAFAMLYKVPLFNLDLLSSSFFQRRNFLSFLWFGEILFQIVHFYSSPQRNTHLFSFPLRQNPSGSCQLWFSSPVTTVTQWIKAEEPLVGCGLTWDFALCLLCEHTQFWGNLCIVSPHLVSDSFFWTLADTNTQMEMTSWEAAV